MTIKIQMLGWAGTTLVLVAYIPQLRHLYVEKCAWGISISTWVIWLAAGVLLLSYCIFRNDTLFTFVQVINISAILTTIMLARRSNRICPYHVATTLAPSTTEPIKLREVLKHSSNVADTTNLDTLCARNRLRLHATKE